MYGAWLRSDNVKDGWKPRLEEDVLECLGPENCAGLHCPPRIGDGKYDWNSCNPDVVKKCVEDANQKKKAADELEKCYDPLNPELKREKGCAKWYPKLIAELSANQKKEIRDTLNKLCEDSQDPITERTGLQPSVAVQNTFQLYNITDTKYRYAVDAVRRHTYNHGRAGTYRSIEDPELLERAERLVAEKCRYGGAYYKLAHYGINTDDKDNVACDELRDSQFKDDSNSKEWLRWLRQNGLDGWFWQFLSVGQRPPYGFLTTPLLLPWEIDSCASTPCPRQCIAIEVDPSQTECPATVASLPLRLTAKFVTNVVVPVLALRLILYITGSIVSRVRCYPRACKDTVRQAKAVRRWCWFRAMRAARKFRKAGCCAQCFCYSVVVLSLYFFAQ